ncbi:ABC transporter permease [Verminephrobacter eiseniae]|uniref:Binding-protein-dependent transport systems inner membrane component n=1 Tax=Verminephrobacter eiseniae (strain EF01-2) TaxID=391735 RepID=A1WMS2_VEREI|nr:ABC transporter permease [Verminephrobacter eiseniae]ABM58929.1 binding-protein-dependent transport systems inner membrane component [Verminephrobacter eiseniae EF01-2]
MSVGEVAMQPQAADPCERLPAIAAPPAHSAWRRRVRWLAGTLSTVLITLAGLLLVTFLLGRVLPADPVLRVVGDRAPQDLYDRVYREMGLHRPLAQQFALFIGDMVRGNFGKSSVTGNPIGEDILRYFPATVELATLAIVLGVLGAIPLGVLCARYAGRWPDHLVRVASLVGHSVPIFWLGIVGLLVFYARLGWVAGPGRLDVAYRYAVPEVTRLMLVDSLLAGEWEVFGNALSHIVLPAALLGLVALGYVARMTRSFLLWQLRQDYTTVLRLKGLSESAILWRHALRNAAGPILAVIALTYAYLLEGAVLTETVFAWPGLGMYITDSLFAADIPAVLTATLLVGLIFMLINIASELIQSALDPRTRRP